MGNLQVFKYKLLLHGKVKPGGVFQATKKDVWTGMLVISDFDFHVQRHQEFPLAKPGKLFHHKMITNKSRVTSRFFQVTFDGWRLFLNDQTFRGSLCSPCSRALASGLAPISKKKHTAFWLKAKSCRWKFAFCWCSGSSSGTFPKRIQISGHGFVNITAESAFCTNGLWTRAFDVHKSLKGLRKPFEQIVEHFILCQMEKYLSSTSELALSGFCSDHFHGSYQVWVYFIFPIRCSYQTKTPLHVLSFPNSGNSWTSEVALPPNLTDKASSNGLDVLGPCMDLSVHVPNGYSTNF